MPGGGWSDPAGGRTCVTRVPPAGGCKAPSRGVGDVSERLSVTYAPGEGREVRPAAIGSSEVGRVRRESPESPPVV